MNPATAPPVRRDAGRLLVIDSLTGATTDSTVQSLPALLSSGDLLVVNDAATLPASLRGVLDGHRVELRLLAHVEDARWRAVLFGAGSWRIPTEHRPAPPPAVPGDAVVLGRALNAMIRRVDPHSPRLLEIELVADTADPLEHVYALGRPVQYSYLSDDLALWSVQTAYGSRPWAVEMPSAGRPLSWSILLAARRRGIGLARVTHAASLSSTGDRAIDAMLPVPERYDVPEETVEAIASTRAHRGRVIAVGTTVVRALEGAARARGQLVAGSGTTDLRIDGSYRPVVVNGLLTGMHDPGESHFELLSAFADRDRLLAGWNHAVAEGYLCHEFGDATLLLPPRSTT